MAKARQSERPAERRRKQRGGSADPSTSLGVSPHTLRRIALAQPGVEEGTSYGTLAFRVRGKFLARLREDGQTLAVKIGFDERDFLMEMDPETFFTTDHYRGYPTVLVRLTSVGEERLRDVLAQAVQNLMVKKKRAVR